MEPIGGARGVSGLNLEAMDGESALLALQAERGALLDQKLKEVAGGVRARNGEIASRLDRIGQMRERIGELKTSIRELATETIPAAETALAEQTTARGVLLAEQTSLEAARDDLVALDGWVVANTPQGEARALTAEEVDRIESAGLSLEGVTYDEQGVAHASAETFAAWHDTLAGDRIPAVQAQIDAKGSQIAAADTEIARLGAELEGLRGRLEAARAELPQVHDEIESLGRQIDKLGHEQKEDVDRLRSVIDRHRAAFDTAMKEIKAHADQRGDKLSEEAYRRALDDLKQLADRRLDEVRDALHATSPDARRRVGLDPDRT